MRASAVADSEINGLRRRKTQASAKSIVCRQARTARCLVALQKRRAVTFGSARSFANNPAVDRLRSPWHDIKGRRRYAKPINNPICSTGLEVGEFSVGCKRPPVHKRIGYGVRGAGLGNESRTCP